MRARVCDPFLIEPFRSLASPIYYNLPFRMGILQQKGVGGVLDLSNYRFFETQLCIRR